MSTAVVMMAKLPIPGYCKNRLTNVLTPDESAEFQRLCILDLTQTIKFSGFPLYVYYARPEEALINSCSFDLNLPSYHSFTPQKGEDLGERMFNATQETLRKHQEVIVIGSDLPDLEPGIFESVSKALKQYDIVLGPCKDGGYYLLGIRKNCPAVFEGIYWSSSRVLEQTLDKARQAGLKISFIGYAEGYRLL